MQQFRRIILPAGLAIAVALLAGCGFTGESQEEPVSLDSNDPPGDIETECEAACERVYASRSEDGCQQSFTHSDGSAMGEDDCVDACIDDDLMRDGEWCVATEAECGSEPEEMVNECLPETYHPPACDHLDAWPHDVIEREQEVLRLVNEHRAEGTNCPATGAVNSPADPVEMNEELRCASRLHSIDMAEDDFFAHDNPDTGETPQDRAQNAGFESPVAENIAFGSPDAEGTVDQWINSDTGHCENMLDPSHGVMGIGMYENHWTQKFGP